MKKSQKLTPPFDQLKPLTVDIVNGTPLFKCQYTARLSPTCTTLPLLLCRENSQSTSPRGCFFNNGCLLAWLYDNHAKIEKEDYDNILEYLATAMNLPKASLADYCALNNTHLSVFGGNLSYEQYDSHYEKAPFCKNAQNAAAFLKERQEKKETQPKRPTIPTPASVLSESVPSGKAVARIELTVWPDMNLFYVTPVEKPLTPADVTPFAQHTKLSVTEVPICTDVVQPTLYAPNDFSKRQKSVLKKLGQTPSSLPSEHAAKQSKADVVNRMKDMKEKYRDGKAKVKRQRTAEVAPIADD